MSRVLKRSIFILKSGVCVLLCFIKPTLGNCYGQGVSHRDKATHTHDWESPTYLLMLSSPSLNYFAGYTGLFLFERTHNYLVDNQNGPSSASDGEPFWDPGVFTIIIIFFKQQILTCAMWFSIHVRVKYHLNICRDIPSSDLESKTPNSPCLLLLSSYFQSSSSKLAGLNDHVTVSEVTEYLAAE